MFEIFLKNGLHGYKLYSSPIKLSPSFGTLIHQLWWMPIENEICQRSRSIWWSLALISVMILVL